MQAHYSPEYRKAWSFFNRQNDSAFYYFNKVVTGSKDSLQIAVAFNLMGTIQSDAGDYFGGQESLLQSLKYLGQASPKKQPYLASDYNELGLNSMSLKNYQTAIGFFVLCSKYLPAGEQRTVLANNIAWAHEEKGDYKTALHLYDSLIRRPATPETFARILTNRATTKWLQNHHYNAVPELIRALQIRQRIHDHWGENSSYKHLADYYATTHPDSALRYALKMYAIARQINSPDDKLTSLGQLTELSSAPAAKKYFADYRALNDSLQDARNAAKNQFALIRYNVEKSKADNLKLQNDNAAAKYEIFKQRILIAVIILLLVILMVSIYLFYQKRKVKQQEEMQDAIRQTQQKDSKKVHDTLANDIYYLMKKVQQAAVIEKEWLINHIVEVYRRARDISYDILPDDEEDFHEQISARLKSFATPATKVLLVGNSAALWQEIDPLYRTELKYVLQELMVNMQKHSHAHLVVVKFENAAGRCSVTYTDDGVGMPEYAVHGNGLRNTGNRIKTLKGEITFEKNIPKGLQVHISFPIV